MGHFTVVSPCVSLCQACNRECGAPGQPPPRCPRLPHSLRDTLPRSLSTRPSVRGSAKTVTGRTLMWPRRPGEEGAGKPGGWVPGGGEIVPPSVAQMTGVSSAQEAVAYVPREVFRAVPRAHQIILTERGKHLPTRFWYMERTLAHGWSRNVLPQKRLFMDTLYRSPGNVSSLSCIGLRRPVYMRDPWGAMQ